MLLIFIVTVGFAPSTSSDLQQWSVAGCWSPLVGLHLLVAQDRTGQDIPIPVDTHISTNTLWGWWVTHVRCPCRILVATASKIGHIQYNHHARWGRESIFRSARPKTWEKISLLIDSQQKWKPKLKLKTANNTVWRERRNFELYYSERVGKSAWSFRKREDVSNGLYPFMVVSLGRDHS